MRSRSVLLPALAVLVVGAACGSAGSGSASGSVPPISLASPGSGAGTGSSGGGVAAQLRPAATPDYLRQVAAETRRIATGRVRLVAAAVGGAGHEGRTTELTVLDGSYDNGAQRTRMRLDPGGARRAGATGLAALLGGPIEVIQIGDVTYLRFGGGARWTRLAGTGASALGPIFAMFELDDLGAFLRALACAGRVDEAGHEAIDGVATNHYRVEAAVADLEACVDRDANASSLLDNLGESERAQVDVWVDGGSLVRRLAVTADERALGGGLETRFPGAASTMTMTLSGFGEPAGIEPPPAGDVEEGLGGLEALLGGGAGQSGDLGDLDGLGDLEDLLAGLG